MWKPTDYGTPQRGPGDHQFDVIANPFAATSRSTPFLLNITGDHLIGYAAVLFAPLIVPSAAGHRRDFARNSISAISGLF
jgi:hypothetical protein